MALGAALIVGVFFIFVFPQVHLRATATNTPAYDPISEETVFLDSADLPLAVSGLVEASDRAVVSARTSGVLTSVLAAEGTYAPSGSVLARLDTPVADARVVLAERELELARLDRTLATSLTELESVQARAVAYSAEEIAFLRASSSDTRVIEATDSLRGQAEQSLLALGAALDFVDDNRSLFDAEALAQYRQVVSDLYGSIPKQFQSKVQVPVSGSQNIQALLELMHTDDFLDVTAMRELSSLIHTELALTAALYEGGERDAYIDNNDARTEAYLTERTALVETLIAHAAQSAAAGTKLDAVLEDATVQQKNVTVTDIDRQMADVQAEFGKAIEAAGTNVAMAGVSLAAAERSLGDVRSPFSGTVAEVLVDEGEYIQAGTPILTLIGSSGRELTVAIPNSLLPLVHTGAEFSTDGHVLGIVDRVGVPYGGHSATAVIVLSRDDVTVGETLHGTLLLAGSDDIFTAPRGVIHFDSEGPYIVYQNGIKARVEIVYDAGTTVYVTTDTFLSEPLALARPFDLRL